MFAEIKMIKSYTILTVLLQAFLWLGVRSAAIETRAYLLKMWDTEVRFPPLSELTYLITPYAWAIPAALFFILIASWKRNDKLTTHALAICNALFLIYLAMCAIGFSMPFIAKMSEFR